MKEKRFSQLSKQGQILIRLCQYVNFGGSGSGLKMLSLDNKYSSPVIRTDRSS